jgi:hypothetical protein
MPTRAYLCAKCNQINQITYKAGTNPTCPCGSGTLSRVTFAPVSASPPVIADAGPVIPDAPAFTPSVKAASAPLKPAHKKVLDALASVKPSGKSLAEELKASKVGKLDQATGERFANRDRMNATALDRARALAAAALPARAQDVALKTQASVDMMLRCLTNNVKVKTINDLTIDFFSRGRHYKLRNQVNLDLTLPLSEMARGKCRPTEHGNANTEFANNASMLPTKVQGELVNYKEFGWHYMIPERLYGKRQGRYCLELLDFDSGASVSAKDQESIAWSVRNNGSRVEAGLRLIMSDWGYLFFTNTHYRTFKIYDPEANNGGGGWKDYERPVDDENYYVTADKSWYHSGQAKAALLPANSPAYW